jgi:hypothetical protein
MELRIAKEFIHIEGWLARDLKVRPMRIASLLRQMWGFPE